MMMIKNKLKKTRYNVENISLEKMQQKEKHIQAKDKSRKLNKDNRVHQEKRKHKIKSFSSSG